MNDYEDDPEEDVDYHSKAEEPDLSGEEMYSLTVQLVSEDEEKRATLMEKKSDSATVYYQKGAAQIFKKRYKLVYDPILRKHFPSPKQTKRNYCFSH